ncbi:DNA-binding response regulator [Amycolatopsis balhimycina DSM 5908]|uniref:DNA-binding response regulator n=1 Tax=Amycolatopsis balhimycina DSM 5908 TaxID=1081091 RepID=A0A428WXV1_AMYBA|nr:response regulator transcription factor [Amycolatopsis balhimycina]RSM47896.1 DNA-binding response regulator [Amycolatopsis balhimycina DSM 5908]
MTTVVLAGAHPPALRVATTGVTVVATAETGAAALDAVRRHRPDVLVLDLALGVDVAAGAGVPVLVFTASADDAALAGALRAGVRGFLPADADPADVVRAVHNVAAGAAVFGDGIADRIPRLLLSPAPLPDLGPRDREILALAAGGVTDTAIARRLGIAPKTVRNRVSVISLKLGTRGRAEAITLARTAGLAPA